MRGKKGFELSATFLVILIITIVIFTGSIHFTRKFFETANEMRGSIDRQTEAEIESLLFQQNQLTGIPTPTKTLKRDQQHIFGLGIRNVLESADTKFWVLVEFARAYTFDEVKFWEGGPLGQSLGYINNKWLLYSTGPYTIAPNTFEPITILGRVDDRIGENDPTQRGVYVFNVCVFTADPGGAPCSSATLFRL